MCHPNTNACHLDRRPKAGVERPLYLTGECLMHEHVHYSPRFRKREAIMKIWMKPATAPSRIPTTPIQP